MESLVGKTAVITGGASGMGGDCVLHAKLPKHMLRPAPQRQARANFAQGACRFKNLGGNTALCAGKRRRQPAKPRADNQDGQRFSSTSSYQVII